MSMTANHLTSLNINSREEFQAYGIQSTKRMIEDISSIMATSTKHKEHQDLARKRRVPLVDETMGNTMVAGTQPTSPSERRQSRTRAKACSAFSLGIDNKNNDFPSKVTKDTDTLPTDYSVQVATRPNTLTMLPLAGRKRPLHVALPKEDHVHKSQEQLTPSMTIEPVVGTLRKPLTLSAYRRPEETVRLADPDVSRRLTDDYELHGPSCGVLGHGATSTVRLAIRRSDRVKVAVKCIPKHNALRSRRFRRRLGRSLHEWDLLQRLQDHPNVVSLLDIYETDEEIFLVLEYCAGGELFEAIQRKRDGTCASKQKAFTETQAASIAQQMLSVLAELHRQKIVHRDLKAENILLESEDGSNMRVKLCDFGVARVLSDDMMELDYCSSDDEVSPTSSLSRSRSFCSIVSDYYSAPEVYYGSGYGTAVDVYSLGVTLFILLCGSPPSCCDEDNINIFDQPEWKLISDSAKNLIRKMLHTDPAKRVTAEAALRDEWIQRVTRENTLAEAAPPVSRIFSPSKPRPVVDLELVRSRLFSDLASLDFGRKEKHGLKPRASKRSKKSKGNEKLVAAAVVDLYRDVASAAASASAAAAGVVCHDFDQSVSVVDVSDTEDFELLPFDPPSMSL